MKLDSTSAAAKLRTSPHHRSHTQVNPRLQSRNPRPGFPRHPAARRAARSHALLLPARSHVFLASPRGRSPPPLQSQTKRRSGRSRRRNRQVDNRTERRRETGGTNQALRRNRSPASPRSGPHGASRSENRHCRSNENVDRTRAREQRQSERNPRASRNRIQYRLSQTTRRHTLQPPESSQAREIRQGTHHLNRRRCPRNSGRRTSHRQKSSRLPPANQTEVHLRRHAASADQPGHRTPAHHVLPGRHSNGPPLLRQSQSAKHSHPHRTRTRHPRRLHRRARPRPSNRRLFADRTPPPGPLLRRSAPGRSLPPRRRHPYSDCLASFRSPAA